MTSKIINKNKTMVISHDNKKIVSMVRRPFNKHKSSRIYNYFNGFNYINFMVKGVKGAPIVSMVRHSPDKRESSRISGFESQSGRHPLQLNSIIYFKKIK